MTSCSVFTRCFIPGIILISLVLSEAAAVLPLRDQWRAAGEALRKNEPEQAYLLFEEFNEWYGSEDQVTSSPFREKLYRLWGLAALQCGYLTRGIDLLDIWLQENPDQQSYRAFVRFQLGSAYLQKENKDAAIQQWDAFLRENPDLPECVLVHWLRADLHFANSMYQDAIGQLAEILTSRHLSSSGKALAQSAIAMALLAQGKFLESMQCLESIGPDRISGIWKSMLAPTLAEQFISLEEHESTLKTIQWFNAPDDLILKFNELHQNRTHPGQTIRRRIWQQHWNNQMRQAAESVISTAKSGWGLNQLYILKLKSLNSAKATRSVLLLSEMLLNSKDTQLDEIRQEAFCFNIEASIQLQDWGGADSRIDAFIKEYPDHPKLTEILFLQARNFAAQKRWAKAISSVERICETNPENESINAWRFARAGWIYHSGNPEKALDAFIQLEKDCPPAWRDYLLFEQARCMEKMDRHQPAMNLYHKLFKSSDYAAVSQQAGIALLKFFLGKMQWEQFEGIRSAFKLNFPHGTDIWTVELLTGSFFEFSGKLDKAIELYRTIALQSDLQAEHANMQISRLLGATGNYVRLREHALEWIRVAAATEKRVHDQTMKDLYDCQQATGKAALPGTLVHQFLDKLLADQTDFPCLQFLTILQDKWAAYSEIIGMEKIHLEWINSMAEVLFSSKRLSAWATCLVHVSDILIKSGRHDSADTNLIHVLTMTDPAILDKDCLYQAAKVAFKYDFPESEQLLERYISHYVQDPRTAGCLNMLAHVQHDKGNVEKAVELMTIIVDDWPDSGTYQESTLQLAEWHYQRAELDKASGLIGGLLADFTLIPESEARALLLKALIDRDSGNLERCQLICERILILYPDIKDAAAQASEIIKRNESV